MTQRQKRPAAAIHDDALTFARPLKRAKRLNEPRFLTIIRQQPKRLSFPGPRAKRAKKPFNDAGCFSLAPKPAKRRRSDEISSDNNNDDVDGKQLGFSGRPAKRPRLLNDVGFSSLDESSSIEFCGDDNNSVHDDKDDNEDDNKDDNKDGNKDDNNHDHSDDNHPYSLYHNLSWYDRQEKHRLFRLRKEQEKEVTRRMLSPSPERSPPAPPHHKHPEADEYGFTPLMLGLHDSNAARIEEVFGSDYARRWRVRVKQQRLLERQRQRKYRAKLAAFANEYSTEISPCPQWLLPSSSSSSKEYSKSKSSPSVAKSIVTSRILSAETSKPRKARKQTIRQSRLLSANLNLVEGGASPPPTQQPSQPPKDIITITPDMPPTNAPKVASSKKTRPPPPPPPARRTTKVPSERVPKKTPKMPVSEDDKETPNGGEVFSSQRLTRQQRSSPKLFYELDHRGKPRLTEVVHYS